MQLNNLKPAPGSTHHSKRIGRGEGSGYGVTAGKGNNGAQSRSGYKTKRGHEGGQMPIQRRLPKRGFKNRNRVEYKVFNLGQVDDFVSKYALKEFSVESLYINGLIGKTDRVKILAGGELKGQFAFKVNGISGKAKEAIEAVGGTVEVIK